MVETIGSRIKSCRKQLHLTQHDLAKRLQGVSHAAISQWESDTTKPNAENLYDLSKVFGCDLAWLLKGGEKTPQIVSYMLNDSVKITILAQEELEKWDSTQFFDYPRNEYIMTDSNYSDFAFAYKIADDSMLPDFSLGDVVVINPDLSPQPGEFVIARYGKMVVFRKFREAENNEFVLLPLNDDYAHISTNQNETKILGTMVEHRIYRRKR